MQMSQNESNSETKGILMPMPLHTYCKTDRKIQYIGDFMLVEYFHTNYT